MQARKNETVTRRRFLGNAARGGAGASVVAMLPQPAGAALAPPASEGTLPTRQLGRIKHNATVVSFGALYLDQPHGTEVVKRTIDAGVNLMHSSITYRGGRAIRSMGALFTAHRERGENNLSVLYGE